MAIADAYVDLHINGDHISGEVRRAVKKQTPQMQQDMDRVGDKLGKRLGDRMGKHFERHMSLRTKAIAALAGTAFVASPHILSLAGSLAEVAKAGALLPAFISAAGASIATLVVGFRGFGAALKNMGDPAKFAESLKNLTPNAREAAKAIKSIAPEWHKLRDLVQDNLFQGFGDEIKKLSGTYIPILRKGMASLAAEIGAGLKVVSAGLRSASATSSVATVFENTAAAAKPFFTGLSSILKVFLKISAVGSSFLPGMAKSFEDIGKRFEAFIDKAAKSGALQQFIQDGITATKQLFRILYDTGRILNGIIKAANAAGGGGLANLSNVLKSIADVVNGPAFQAGLTDFFKGLVEGVKGVTSAFPALGQVLAALGPILGDIAAVLGPAIGDGLKLLAALITPLLGPLQTMTESLSGASGPLLLMAAALAKFGGLVGLGGPLKIILVALTALTAIDGAAFSSAINGMVRSLTDLVTGLAEKLPQIVQTVLPTLVQNLVANIPTLVNAAQTLLTTVVGQVIPALVQALIAALPILINGVVLLIQNLVRVVATNLPVFLNAVVNLFLGLVKGLTAVIPILIPMVLNAILTIVQTIMSMAPQLLNAAIQVFTSLIQGLVQILPTLIQTLLDMVPILLQTLLNLIPVLLNTGITLFHSLIDAVITVVPMLIQSIMDMLPVIIQSLTDMLPSLLSTAIDLFLSLVTAWQQIVPTVLEMVPGLIDALVPVLIGLAPTLLQAGVQLFIGLVKALVIVAPKLVAVVPTLIKSVISALLRAIPALLAAAVKLVGALLKGFRDAVPKMLSAGKDLIMGLVNGIKSINLGAIVESLANTIPGWMRKVLGISGGSSTVTSSIGQAAGNGLITGMDNAQPAVARAAENLALVSIDQLKRTMAANQAQISAILGADAEVMTRGKLAGVNNLTAANAKIQKAINARTKRPTGFSARRSGTTPVISGGSSSGRSSGGGGGGAAKKKAAPKQSAAQKTLLEIGQDLGRSMVLGLTGTTEKGVAAAITKLDKLVIKGFTAKLGTAKGTKAAAAFIKRTATTNKKLLKLARDRAVALKKISDQTAKNKEIKAFADKVKADLTQFGSFTSIEDASKATTSNLVENLNSRLAKIKQFAVSIANLKKLGLNKTTLEEIIAAGPEAGNQLALRLLEGGKGVISEVNDVVGQITTSAGTVADQAATAMFGIGVAASEGLLKGLQSQANKLATAATTLANSLIKAVKKALGIKSPSVVMAKQGDMAVAGFVNSIAAGQRAAAAAGQMLGASAVPSIGRAGAGTTTAIPRTSTVTNGPVTVNMTVSVDDLAKMSKVGDFMDMLQNARMNQRRQIGTVNG